MAVISSANAAISRINRGGIFGMRYCGLNERAKGVSIEWILPAPGMREKGNKCS